LVSDQDQHPATQLFNVSGKHHYLPAGLDIGLAEHSGDDVLFTSTHTAHAAPGDLHCADVPASRRQTFDYDVTRDADSNNSQIRPDPAPVGFGKVKSRTSL